MKTTKIALTMLVVAALVATPASATEQEPDDESDPPCIRVAVDPFGVYADPDCIIRDVEEIVDDNLRA